MENAALFLPAGLIQEAADRAGGLDLLERAVEAALERFIAMPGVGTINLMPPLTPEWQSTGVIRIPQSVMQQLEQLPFNLHAVLAAALLTVDVFTEMDEGEGDADPIYQTALNEETVAIYPMLPFLAKRKLSLYGSRDWVCARALVKFLSWPLGEIAEKVTETWMKCNPSTVASPADSDTITAGGGR